MEEYTDFTTVTLRKSTKKKLDELGSVSQSRDEVVLGLINFYKRYKDIVNR